MNLKPVCFLDVCQDRTITLVSSPGQDEVSMVEVLFSL